MNSALNLRELKQLINSFKITSSSYSLEGKNYELIMSKSENENNSVDKKYYITHLAETIYNSFHCRVDDSLLGLRYFQQNDNRDFVEKLSTANYGTGSWEPGWKVTNFEKDGRLSVSKDKLTLWIPIEHFIPVDKGIEIGKEGYIPMVKEFRRLLPGFYVANSDKSFQGKAPLVRIYWNISFLGAIPLMTQLTFNLNKKEVPFSFKILNNRSHFVRSDAAVLYINKQDLNNSIDLISSIYGKVKSYLKTYTSIFAKKIASGLALAEDPNNRESFGQHRSRILAESLYSLYELNITAPDDRDRKIIEYFNENEIDINLPYINKNSENNYDSLFKGAFSLDVPE